MVLARRTPTDELNRSLDGSLVGPRAKVLRRDEVRADTRAALLAFERAAGDWESMRSTRADEPALSIDDRFLRDAAIAVVDALGRELSRGTLPADLELDVERWIDGDFRGSDADVELANHAIFALLGSATCAELDRRDD